MDPARMLDLIASRRTTREFVRERPVPADSLDRVLDAGLWAPRSVYAYMPPRLVACRGEARDRLVDLALGDHTVLRYVRRMYERSPLGADDAWREMAASFGRQLGGAPVVVAGLVWHDDHRVKMDHNLGAAWAAAENMMIQAAAEGLASGVVTLASSKVRMRIVEQLGFDPHEWTVAWLLNLGFSDAEPDAMARDRDAREIRD